jgi:hypothetical protein
VIELNSKYEKWENRRGRELDVKAPELIENRSGQHQDEVHAGHFTCSTADHAEEREEHHLTEGGWSELQRNCSMR